MSVTDLHRLMPKIPSLGLININIYAKFCQIPSNHSNDIELKPRAITLLIINGFYPKSNMSL